MFLWIVSLYSSCLHHQVSSVEQTQEMIGNIVALMKDQPAPSPEEVQIPDKNTTREGV